MALPPERRPLRAASRRKSGARRVQGPRGREAPKLVEKGPAAGTKMFHAFASAWVQNVIEAVGLFSRRAARSLGPR